MIHATGGRVEQVESRTASQPARHPPLWGLEPPRTPPPPHHHHHHHHHHTATAYATTTPRHAPSAATPRRLNALRRRLCRAHSRPMRQRRMGSSTRGPASWLRRTTSNLPPSSTLGVLIAPSTTSAGYRCERTQGRRPTDPAPGPWPCKLALPSPSMRALPSFWSRPQAPATNASLTLKLDHPHRAARQVLRQPGTYCAEQVGVNAPAGQTKRSSLPATASHFRHRPVA